MLKKKGKFPTTPTHSILYTVPMYSIVVSCDVTEALFVTDAVYPHVVFGVFRRVSCLVYVCTWSHDSTIADCWNYACKLLYNPPNIWDDILQRTTYVCKGS